MTKPVFQSVGSMPESYAALSADGETPASRVPVGMTRNIERFLDSDGTLTPFLVLDLETIGRQLARLRACMAGCRILYAVKANPAPAVIGHCAALGTGFDLASRGEIDRCLELGVAPERLSFGSTIKKEADIAYAFGKGIRLFAFDSDAELAKIGRAAPGSDVFCRILADGQGAEWPLSHKFGCSLETAVDLLQRARHLGLRPAGLSFHVGSQQLNPQAWDVAIGRAAHVFTALAHRKVDLAFLNIGGGFPGQYRAPIPPIEQYGEVIDASLSRHFGHARPEILAEPGRYLVADAGFLQSEVVLIARKSRGSTHRWIYLDCGRYNGLPETIDESIKFRLWIARPERTSGPVFLAGPTCDSADVLYRRTPYELPLDMEVGERLGFLSAGAYTASYASVEFNGFAPIRTYIAAA